MHSGKIREGGKHTEIGLNHIEITDYKMKRLYGAFFFSRDFIMFFFVRCYNIKK